MLEQTVTDILPSGFKLVRHYDAHEVNNYSIDRQCGPRSYYSALVDQLIYQALEYYNKPDLRNKFLEKVEFHAVSFFVPMPSNAIADAYCIDKGAGLSRIDIRYFDEPSFGGYRMIGATSHEMGHAHHNWSGVFREPSLLPFRQLFERQFSINKSLYDPYAKPWDQPWGPGSRDEDVYEQYANAYRFFFGVLDTRGKSGAAPELVVPGFENPANHPEWKKQIRLLPETCAFALKYGVKPGTLTWMNGTDGYWQFQRTDGVWVAQTEYFTWYEYKLVNGAWGWVNYPSGQPNYVRT